MKCKVPEVKPAKRIKVYVVPSFHFDNAWHLSSSAYARFTSDRIIKTAVDILRTDNNFHFTIDHISSMEDFIKRYPEDSEYLKQEIKKGRVEIAGPVYTQMDSLMLSGESYVSQIIYGKKQITSFSGVAPAVEWLVDIYGYCNQLPQIMHKSGITQLVIALWWLRINRKGKEYLKKYFQHDNFIWQSPDGSSVLVHNSPNYVGLFLPGDEFLNGTPSSSPHNRDKKKRAISAPGSYNKVKDSFLKLYNELRGKGGADTIFMHMGGDFREPYLANIFCLNRLKKEIGFPEIVLATPSQYFKDIKRQHLNVFTGEINPVYDSRFGEGYYETKIKIKQLNRKLEYAAAQAQFMASLSSIRGKDYPGEEISGSLKPMLYYQHHDPFIGNILRSEYNHLIRKWKESLHLFQRITDSSLKYLSSQIDTRKQKTPLIVFNTLGWKRKCLVNLNRPGETVLSEVPPFGCKAIDLDGESPKFHDEMSCAFIKGYFHVYNNFYKAKVDFKGNLAELYDRETGKQVLKKDSPANEFILEEDSGCFCHIRRTGKYWSEKTAVSAAVKKESRHEIVLSAEVRIKDATISKEIFFRSFDRRIDFKTTVILPQGRDLRLKVIFPLRFKKGQITAETPFGWARRKEGVSAMINWVDYSVSGYGLTLFNRGIPSYEAKDGILSLHLVKGLSLKEPHGDCLPPALREKMIEKGEFLFDYGIYPHAGNIKKDKIIKEGYEYNFPFLSVETSSRKGTYSSDFSLFRIEPFNLTGCLVKNAESGDGIVLRLYEVEGKRTAAEIIAGLPIKSCYSCNLLESEEKEIPVKDGILNFPVKPHEIITLKITT